MRKELESTVQTMGRDTAEVRNKLTDKGNDLRDSHDSLCAHRNVLTTK
jgi:hypothetical protein